jgi:hypothetical protein
MRARHIGAIMFRVARPLRTRRRLRWRAETAKIQPVSLVAIRQRSFQIADDRARPGQNSLENNVV